MAGSNRAGATNLGRFTRSHRDRSGGHRDIDKQARVRVFTVERAALGSRVDRWLGIEADAPYFQRKARLEVSGILHDRDGEVGRRLKSRIDRLQLSESLLPAYVIIVEFSNPLAQVDKHERT